MCYWRRCACVATGSLNVPCAVKWSGVLSVARVSHRASRAAHSRAPCVCCRVANPTSAGFSFAFASCVRGLAPSPLPWSDSPLSCAAASDGVNGCAAAAAALRAHQCAKGHEANQICAERGETYNKAHSTQGNNARNKSNAQPHTRARAQREEREREKIEN